MISQESYSRRTALALDDTVSVLVPLDASGAFCIATRVATNLIVDVTGRFPSGGGYRSFLRSRLRA